MWVTQRQTTTRMGKADRFTENLIPHSYVPQAFQFDININSKILVSTKTKTPDACISAESLETIIFLFGRTR